MKQKRRVTIQEIADALSLSNFSVSRALNGKPGISNATRDQIVATAREMGYPIRRAERARPLNDVVVLMLPRKMTVDAEYWPRLIVGVQEAVRARGAHLLMEVVTPEEEEQLRVPPSLQRLTVDGLVCTGLSQEHVAALHRAGHNVVTIDSFFPELGIDGVMADNRTGTKEAVRYLWSVGHRRIGFIGNNRWADSYYHRWLGYREAMEDLDLEILPGWCLLRNEPDLGPWEMLYLRESIADRSSTPTAWVCVNDLTALNLVQVLAGQGLTVPDDVSVVGFDDLDRSRQVIPALSTVQCHKEAMGARCVERLFRRLERPGDPPDLLLVGTRFIPRESVKRLDVASHLAIRME